MFSKIDKNNDGYITLNELKNALKNKYDDVTLQKLIRSIDSDKNGAINYTEFIAATLTGNVLSDDQKIQIAFDVLDSNGDGFIGEKELA
jgi:calcium-dependent protein kinase